MPKGVGIGLGSNLGDCRAHLEYARKKISRHPKIKITAFSSYHKTAPWGVTDQPDFLNAVAIVETVLTPDALLSFLQQLEHQRRRKRKIRWGRRTLDLDILWYGARMQKTKRLNLPHPEMVNRGFVLLPLLEVRPRMRLRSEYIFNYFSRLTI